MCSCMSFVETSHLHSKAPVAPSHVSTALACSCLIFQSALRLQENPDIFHEKGPVTMCLQRL